MDSKSIVLEKKERMKFFKVIQISSFLVLNWACLFGVQGIPVPFHKLYSLYSKLHNQLPRNVSPNIFSLDQETPVEEFVMSDLLISSQVNLCLMMENIQHACEYDLCSPLLSIYVRPHYRIFEPTDLDIETLNHLLKRDTDIWFIKCTIITH